MNRKAALRTIVYVVLFLFFTLLFVLLNYPSKRLTDQVNGMLLDASKGTVHVENVRFKPPLSLEVGEVILEAGHRSVDMGRAVVGMRFSSFLSGDKGADIRLENPWLDSSFTVVSSGEGWDLDTRKIEVDLSTLPEDFMPFPLHLKGKVSVSLNLVSADASKGVYSGAVRIKSEPIEMSGDLLEALGLAPFRITSLMAVAAVKDNILTLGENSMEGDLAGTARGDIRINPANFEASRLNLTVELRPGPEHKERLTPLFALVGARPRADGSVSFRVRGTVGEPSITM